MAKTEVITSDKIQAYSRLSFTYSKGVNKLVTPAPFDVGQVPRHEATFILDPADIKGMEGIKATLKAAADIGKQRWGVVPYRVKQLAAVFIPGAKAPDPKKDKEDGIETCFYDGDTKADKYEGYAGMFIVPTHNTERPKVTNKKATLVEFGDDEFPMDGNYVRGSFTLWTQDNKYGKRIGGNLRGVQYWKYGEPFSGRMIPDDEFAPLPDEDDIAGSEDDDIPF